MTQKKNNNSGYYTTPEGRSFHAHGKAMSDFTIEALGKMADQAAKMMNSRCPKCAGTWDKVLHYSYKEKRWVCDCGWDGDEPNQVEDDGSTWGFYPSMEEADKDIDP